MTYLAALGLVRVVTMQFDPTATCWWDGTTLRLNVSRDGLEDFLIDEYQPTPILSPWNGGSGYGEKDKAPRIALDKILQSGAARLAAFVATDACIGRVGVQGQQDKGAYVQKLRNSVPDAAVPWIDASVVLTIDASKGTRKAVFPPLLGTGGNDGRYDFSTNFHQRLADVLPELGAKRAVSRTWLNAALDGGSTPLASATIGQFDPVAAGGPGGSAFDDAGSFVNPWIFVLMIEGLVYFASAPVRRFGETTGRAAMPFTVNESSAGPTPGSDKEESRGELWAPVWNRPLSSRDVANLFTSARTSWDGRTATGAAHMYASLRSSGIDRRADRFFRYGFVQRNGLAFSAVLLDEIKVEVKPDVQLGIAIEDRVRPYLHVEQTNRLEPVHRAYEAARVSFYRDPTAERLLAFLASATEVERTVGLTLAARKAVSFAGARLRAEEAVQILAGPLREVPEYRVAAGLASGRLRHDGVWWSLADLLLGRPPGRPHESFSEAVVKGFGDRPLTSVLTDLMVWRLQHRVDAVAAPGSERAGMRAREAVRVEQPASAGIPLMDRYGSSAPWQDVHAWAQGRLDDSLVERGLAAMMALDWAKRVERERWTPDDVVPCPELAVLHPFARAAVTVSPQAPDEGRRGIAPEWPGLLAAGQTQPAIAAAVSLLNRSAVTRWTPIGPEVRIASSAVADPIPTIRSERLAAALWVPANYMQALEQVARLVPTTNTEENAS